MHLVVLPLIAAIFLAVNMGGSGISAAFSSTYGANLIRKDLIPGLFGAFVLLGALISGSQVTSTIGEGIVDNSYFSISVTTILLTSIGLSMLFANILKVPQSTSQSTVFALTGIGAYLSDINTDKLLLEIIPAWFYLPIAAFFLTFLTGKFLYRPIVSNDLINFVHIRNHPVLKYCVIISSCFVAYSIGANNVANASGPVYSLINNLMGSFETKSIFIIIATLLVAPWFGIGGSFFSSRVLETTGKNIITFGPLGALTISIVTGSLLLFASLNGGIPAALAQLNVGAIVGLGVYKEGLKNTLSKDTVKKIFFVWIIAPVTAFFLAYGLMYIFC